MIDVKGHSEMVSTDSVTLRSVTQRRLDTTTRAESRVETDEEPSVGDKRNLIEYALDKIVAHRRDYEKTLYKLLWYGYTQGDNTWKPAHHLSLYTSSLVTIPAKGARRRQRDDDNDIVTKTMQSQSQRSFSIAQPCSARR